MDHSDRIKQNLEILGLESLEDLSLGELFTAIGKNIPSDVSKSRILNIYAMWLHSRLVVIDVSDGAAFVDEIASWYQFLKALTNDDSLIIGAFRDWQRGEVLDNPTSSRRLSIAEAELTRLMPTPSTEPESSPTCSDGNYGKMHPDRVKRSQKSGTFIDFDGHYGQMHPDRVERSQNPHTVIEIEDDEPEIVVLSSSHTWPKDLSTPPSHGQDGQPDLSFLTGANMLALSDIVRPYCEGQDLGAPSPESMGMTVPVPLESRLEGSKSTKAGNSKKPRKEYLCDRCGVKGHDIKECPTNLDPSFDRKPPANYKCNFCGKTGRHYGPLCPKHPDANAIAHQRRKAFSRRSKAGLNNGKQGRRDTQSSRSIRDTSEEFSRLRLTPVFDRQGKRKASRSPSPDRGVPEKKSKAPIGGAKKKTIETVRLGVDDLIERFRRREAPLANNDKQDERVQGVPEHELGQHSLSPSTPSPPTPTSLPMSKVVEVGEAETPISLKSEDASCAIEDQLLELALAEMIQTESVKTDLLLLVNGVERLPPYHPFLLELFRGRESVWVNEASKKTRACPVDFFCFLDEEEKAETVDYEMVMEVENVKEGALVWVLIDEEAADSSSALVEQEKKQAESVDRGEMAVEVETLNDKDPVCVLLDVGAADSATVPREPALQVEVTEGDEEMADAEPATSVDESGAGAILVMLATEPLQIEGSLPTATAEGDEEMADVKPAVFVDESGAGAMSIMPATEILPTEESPSNEAKTGDVWVGAIAVPTAHESSADGVMQAVIPGEPVIKDAGDSEMAGAKLSPVIEDAHNLEMAGAESSPDGFVQEAAPGEPVTKDAHDSEMAGTESLSVQGSQIGLGTEPSATC